MGTHKLVRSVFGADIHYRVSGRGKPVVLLHGNGEDMRVFHYQLPVLENGFLVMQIDSRGHGWSTRGSRPLRFELMAQDVKAVLDAEGIAAADIVGLSDGANLAITFALASPDRVSGLFLNAGNIFPEGLEFPVYAAVWAQYLFYRAAARLAPGFRQKAEVVELMTRHPRIKPHRLRSIRCPALVVVGDRDIITPAHTRLMVNSMPGARLAVLPHADHFAATRIPDRFNRVLLDFLHRDQPLSHKNEA